MSPEPELTDEQLRIRMLETEVKVIAQLLEHKTRECTELQERCRRLAQNVIDLGRDNGKLRARLERLR